MDKPTLKKFLPCLPEFFNANIPKFRNKYTNSPKNIPKFLKILTQYIQITKLILPCSKWLFLLWKLGHLPQNLTCMKNRQDENMRCFKIIPIIISTIVIIFILFLWILFLFWYIKNLPKVYQNTMHIPFLKFPYHGLSK